MFSQLSARYPELVAPLIAERDLYLAWSLKRSKAVNGAACVVGVVGITIFRESYPYVLRLSFPPSLPPFVCSYVFKQDKLAEPVR